MHQHVLSDAALKANRAALRCVQGSTKLFIVFKVKAPIAATAASCASSIFAKHPESI